MENRDIALLILVTAIWGGNFAVIQYGLEDIPPLALSSIRFLAAAFPACLLLPFPNISLTRLLAIGMTLGTLMSAFQFAGMSLGVGVATSSVVLQSQSFITVLLAVAILGERPTGRAWFSIIIGIVGLICFLGHYWENSAIIGLFMIIVAAFWWALGNLLIKGAPTVDAIALMAWMSIVPIVPLAALSFAIEGSPSEIFGSIISLKGLASALYLGLGVMIFGYGIWSKMLQKYDTLKVVPFSLLVPIFGLAFGIILFEETVSNLQLIGTALLVVALILNIFSKTDDRV